MIDENSRIGFVDGKLLKFVKMEGEMEVWESLDPEDYEKAWVEEYSVEVRESPEYLEQSWKDFNAI